MNSPIFILSTGRTGTQFFEDYINQTSNKALCKHEPRPSWRFKFLSNMYLNNKISGKTITTIYRFSRKSLFNDINSKIYIESSNFIFGCINALNEYYNNIKIIHIIRHPVTYIESHLNHGFWKGHKKIFAKYIPFWLERINIQNHSNPVHILSERWNYVNTQISLYRETNKYTLVKFEDLFSENRKLASETLNGVRKFCSLNPVDITVNLKWLEKPKNYSRNKFIMDEKDKNYIYKNNKSIMLSFNYLK